MKQYEKPMVEIICNKAEGVYAASGMKKHPLCDSDYINNGYKVGTFKEGDSYLEYYGCFGCPQSRDNAYCSLGDGADYDQSGQSGTYETKTNAPRWERENEDPNAKMVINWYS